MVNKLTKLCDYNVVRLAWKPRPHDKKQICFYLAENGTQPVIAWMCGYAGCRNEGELAKVLVAPSSMAKQISTFIIWKLVWYLRERIATWQLPKVPEHYRHLKSIGCWEVKHETGRLIGFYDGELFIVVHGFEKKTDGKTPGRHLKMAKDRKADYEKRKKLLGL